MEGLNSANIDCQTRTSEAFTCHNFFNAQQSVQTVRMSTNFTTKKQKILQQLNVAPEEYTDASPKGSVDEPIRKFVDEINEIETLVTTSSCSGRFAVYLEGQKKGTADENDSIDRPLVTSSGGKGGGQWLFVTHTALPNPPSTSMMLAGTDSLPSTYSGEPFSSSSRLVHFKFEPMILHILASSLDAARKVLSAAQTAGFRESGISSIADKTDMVMVAVRSTGLSTDSPIGHLAIRDDQPVIALSVSDEYVQGLVRLANDKFVVNAARTANFRTALLAQFRAKDDDAWEPIEARRARMREQGLRKKAEHQRNEDHHESTTDVVEEDVGLADML